MPNKNKNTKKVEAEAKRRAALAAKESSIILGNSKLEKSLKKTYLKAFVEQVKRENTEGQQNDHSFDPK